MRQGLFESGEFCVPPECGTYLQAKVPDNIDDASWFVFLAVKKIELATYPTPDAAVAIRAWCGAAGWVGGRGMGKWRGYVENG